ncbi:hypothetical protein PBY51_006344 [Eleginops maclovinus]|uniref:Uncharacterized protein n=1 Tax=Eleginops maclovinus TaxID=56733 RepID=A0AAN7WU16_ELEMC|nr:hypothetical protein PBY51_006344 [Eleginops maclovinus]
MGEIGAAVERLVERLVVEPAGFRAMERVLVERWRGGGVMERWLERLVERRVERLVERWSGWWAMEAAGGAAGGAMVRLVECKDRRWV